MNARTIGVFLLAAALVFPARLRAQEPQQCAFDRFITEATQAQAKADFESAESAYQNAVRCEKNIPELWANLGLVEYQMGKYPAAKENLQRALSLKSSLFAPNLFLGLEYLRENRPASAVPYLDAADAINPKDLQAVLALGNAYSALKTPKTAERYFYRATGIDPRSQAAWFGLGVAYLEEVEESARILLGLKSGTSHSMALLGEALANQGKLDQAAVKYEEALRGADAPFCTRAELGFVLVRQGNLVKARSEFEREIEDAPGCALAQLGLARLEIAQDRLSTAANRMLDLWVRDEGFVSENLPYLLNGLERPQMERLCAAMQDDPRKESSSAFTGLIQSHQAPPFPGAVPPGRSLSNSLPAQHGLSTPQKANASAVLAFSEGRYTACAHALQPHIEELDSGYLGLLEDCSFFTGDFQTALSSAHKLLDKKQSGVDALYWSIKVSQKLAVEALARAGEIDPNSPRTHVLLGDIYRQQQHYDEAKIEYRKALDLASNNSAALLGLTATSLMLQQTDNAISAGKLLVEQNENDPEANLLLAEAYVQQENYQQAEPLLHKCTGVKPELQPRIHILLGRIYASEGYDTQAVSELEKGIGADEDGSVHFTLGRLYHKLGNQPASLEAMKIAKDLANARNARAAVALQDVISHRAND